MFALVDCNSFYASCEQIFRPDLRGKPVVVLSNNDGCIVARNQEAKALNIPDLQPYFQIKQLLAQHNVQVFSSNYELYGDISKRIMHRLGDFTDNLEVYSIDEAFLSLQGFTQLQQHGQRIKQTCWQEQRMPVSVGIAPSKTLAKLANHIAKKSQKLEGVCVIENLNDWQPVFKKLAVNKVWGIGSRLAQRLALMNIHTVQQLQSANTAMLRKNFGVNLERCQHELNGMACFTIEPNIEAKKNIISSRSFGEKVTALNELQQAVANYTATAALKLRKQQSFCQQLQVSLETSRFSSKHPYRSSQIYRLQTPSNDSRLLIQKANQLCEKLYQPGFAYNKASVCLGTITQQPPQQDLLTPEKSKSHKLMQTVDALNQHFGKGQVFIARQVAGSQAKWPMRRTMRSPCYSTKITDIPVIKL